MIFDTESHAGAYAAARDALLHFPKNTRDGFFPTFGDVTETSEGWSTASGSKVLSQNGISSVSYEVDGEAFTVVPEGEDVDAPDYVAFMEAEAEAEALATSSSPEELQDES